MQELIVLLILAVAAIYLGNRAYRGFSKKEAGCGKGCGCATDLPVKAVSVKDRL